MNYAYDDMYLEDAMNCLGEAMDYAFYSYNISMDKFLKLFISSGYAKECEIQVGYAIGLSEPVSFNVFTYGTGIVSDLELCEMVKKVFNFKPGNIIKELDLLNLDYRKLASGGHFGKENIDLPYERVDKVKEIKKHFQR